MPVGFVIDVQKLILALEDCDLDKGTKNIVKSLKTQINANRVHRSQG